MLLIYLYFENKICFLASNHSSHARNARISIPKNHEQRIPGLASESFLNIKDDVKMIIVGQCVTELEDGAILQIGKNKYKYCLHRKRCFKMSCSLANCLQIIALAPAGISENERQKHQKSLQVMFRQLFGLFYIALACVKNI